MVWEVWVPSHVTQITILIYTGHLASITLQPGKGEDTKTKTTTINPQQTNLKLRFCFKLQPTQAGKHSSSHGPVCLQSPTTGHRRITPNHGVWITPKPYCHWPCWQLDQHIQNQVLARKIAQVQYGSASSSLLGQNHKLSKVVQLNPQTKFLPMPTSQLFHRSWTSQPQFLYLVPKKETTRGQLLSWNKGHIHTGNLQTAPTPQLLKPPGPPCSLYKSSLLWSPELHQLSCCRQGHHCTADCTVQAETPTTQLHYFLRPRYILS